MMINIPLTMIRGTHDKVTIRNGNKYSRKRPNPKHTKKISGGCIGTAALSFELFFIL